MGGGAQVSGSPEPDAERDLPPPAVEAKARRGVAHFVAALGYSIAGWGHAVKHEPAIRQELTIVSILTLASLWLPLERLEHLVLVMSMLFVLVIELLNSALEATVDRISLVRHPLAGRAKDMGSAAVFTSIGMSALAWAVLVGPMAWQWVSAKVR